MGKLSIAVRWGQHEVIHTSRRVLAGRPSVVARLETGGLTLYAEATPLSGFGADSIHLAEDELRNLTAEGLEEAAREAAGGFSPQRSGLLLGPDDPAAVVRRTIGRQESPSARFAAETLVLGAAAAARGVPLWRLLAAECVAPELFTSAVIDPLAPAGKARMHQEIAAGVRTFKLKCGSDRDRELELVEELAQTPQEIRVRLDPNQAWTVEQAIQFVSACPKHVIDWIEDPTAEPAEWREFRRATGVAIAIDEPLSQGISQAKLMSIDPDVLILKPMALGGAYECLQLVRLAKEQNYRVSVSHFFDGRSAMSAAIHLAFAVQSPGIAPGLGRHVALESGDDEAPFPPELAMDRLTCPAAARESSLL